MHKGEEMKEQIDKIKEILQDAKFKAGGEIFMSGDGIFVNKRCEYLQNSDVLIKCEKLRQAVSRSYDLICVLSSTVESK